MARKSRNVVRGGCGRPSKPSSAVLPDDILYMICQYFCSHCCNEYQWPFGPPPGAKRAQNTSILYTLCLVSRSFRDMAQPILFHSFHPEYPLPRKTKPWNHWKFRLEPFLRTVAARPDLARCVRAVFLQRLLIHALSFYRSRTAFHDCVRALGTNPQKLFSDGHDTWDTSPIKRAFFLGTPVSVLPAAPIIASHIASELLSVVVAILPNLVHLVIEEDLVPRPRWQCDVSPITLNALGIWSIPVKTIESDRPLHHLLSRSNRLETLVTMGVGEYPKMPTVRHLHLRHQNQFSEGHSHRCIDACSGALVTLSTAETRCAQLFRFIYRPSLFNTIEVLHLDMEESRDKRPLRSLRGFTKLRELLLHTHLIYDIRPSWCPPTFLYEETLTNILPPSLVDLYLIADVRTQKNMEPDLHEVMKWKNGPFSKLQSIRTNVEIHDRSLLQLADDVGVELVSQARRGKNQSHVPNP